MTQFKDYLTNILAHTNPFHKVLSHVNVRQKDGHTLMMSTARDGSVFITAETDEEIEGLENPACLGSLDYLKKTLDSSYAKKDNFRLEMSYGESSDKKAVMLQSILFTDGERANIFYKATDPFIANINKIDVPDIDEWKAVFAVDKNLIKDFTEISKIHMAAPKMAGREDVFQLVVNEGVVEAVFGDKGHQSSAILSSELETEVDTLSVYLLLNHFQLLLRMSEQSLVFMNEKAVKIEIEDNDITYSFIMSAKKLNR